jgi:DNA-directed RNA polymerase subunit alpha
LLSALEGYAITSVRIEGVDHEFSTISGVVEDVTEIILNLNKYVSNVKLKIYNEAVTISVSGKDQLTAGDFQNSFQVSSFESRTCYL